MNVPDSKLRVFRLGTLTVQMRAHKLPGVGARVFMQLDDAGFHYIGNIAPDELRLFSNQSKIFACEADALERRAAPPINQPKYA